MRHFLLIFFTLVFSNLFSQKQRLTIGGYSPGLYIDYTVSPNETFASIASAYNLSPDTLSEFNNMDYFEGTLRAKTLKIPLNPQNFYQQGSTESDEGLVPVYFVATYNQSLQQITTKVNRVPLTSLKKWNSDAPETVLKGSSILVGFLRAKENKLAFFEDTMSAASAKVEIPSGAKPKEVNSTELVSTSKNASKVKTITASTTTGKKDSTIVARNVPAPTTNVSKNPEVRRDSSNVARNIPAPTTNLSRTPVIKRDSSAIVANNNRNKEPIKVIIKPKPSADSTTIAATNKKNATTVKRDTSGIATNRVRNNAGVKTNDKTKTAVDSSDITAYNGTSTSNSANAKNNSVKTNTTAKLLTNKADDKSKVVAKDSTALAANTKTWEVKKNNTPVKKADSSVIVSNTKMPVTKSPTTTRNTGVRIDSTITALNSKRPNANAPVDKKADIKITPATTTKTTETKTPANTSSITAVTRGRNTGNKENTAIVGEGFEGMYNGEISDKPQKQLSGDASFFESRTGWNDKKYYVLMPHVTAGTVVKITSKDNRSVYAKVLGDMPEMKENNGVLLRLSNAAVAALGINNPTFPVVVSFY